MIRLSDGIHNFIKAARPVALTVSVLVILTCFGEIRTQAAGSFEKSVGIEKAGGLIRQCDIDILRDDYDVDKAFEDLYGGSAWKKNFTKKDLKYMASIIYCEAMDMCLDSRVAVGNIILNRMNDKSSDWGHVNTIKEVIYDRKWAVQFSPTVGSPSKLDKAMKLYSNMDSDEYPDWMVRCMKGAIEAAKLALAGYKTVPDDFMYFNGYIEKSKAKCESSGKRYIIMDNHIYF